MNKITILGKKISRYRKKLRELEVEFRGEIRNQFELEESEDSDLFCHDLMAEALQNEDAVGYLDVKRMIETFREERSI